jgi:MoaA/NifB/PqqE/SkfB family radical SAM enzyme
MSSPTATRHEFFADAADGVLLLANRVTVIAKQFRSSAALHDANVSLARLTREIGQFAHLVSSLRGGPEDEAQRFTIHGSSPDQQLARLAGWLQQLVAAQSGSDWGTVADILELDLEPLLREWVARLSRLPIEHDIHVAAARAATASHATGSVSWMRSVLAWWGEQNGNGRSRVAFVQLLRDLGIRARELTLHAPAGETRTVVVAHLGDGSETTRGLAVVDPDHLHVFTSPDGRMAHPDQLQRSPNWVAADRCERRESSGAHDWMFWSPGPRAINFQIGDVCNMHCIMCWQDLRRADQPRDQWHPEMTAEMIVSVLERHVDAIDSVELVSFGEPMANPQFDEIAHAIGDLGTRRGRPFWLNIITNGSLLHKRRHIDILRQPGELTFSIDAADQSIYEFIRDGGSWNDVVTNLRAAVRHPQRHQSRKIGINMTVFQPNLESVFAMGAFAAGLGLDYLSILHGAGLGTTRAKGMEIDRQDPRLADQLDRIRQTFPWLQLNDYATGRTLPALPNGTLPDRGFCPLPWKQFDVGPDGHAHPCCRSYATDLGSPSEAWLGEPMTELRRQILAGEVDSVRFADCAACPNLGVPALGATSAIIPLKSV